MNVYTIYLLCEFFNYIKYKKKLNIISTPHYQPTRNSLELLQTIQTYKKVYTDFCMNTNQLVETKSKEYGYLCTQNIGVDFFMRFSEFDTCNKKLVQNDIQSIIKNDYYGNKECIYQNEGCMSFGKMNVDCIYRPLVIDATIYLIQKIITSIYNHQGYTTHSISNGEYMQKYYYFHNPNATKTILFIHGIGIGTSMYMNFIQKLNTKKYSILLIEINGIGTPFNEPIVSNFTNFTYTILRILKKHKLDKSQIILIGHSLGTDYISCINNINNTHQLFNVSHIVLLDPVCFLHGILRTHYIMFASFDDFKKIFPFKSIIQKIKCYLFYYLVIKNISTQFITKRVLSSATDIIFRDTNKKCLVYLGMNDTLIHTKNIEPFINEKTFPNIEKFTMNERHGSFLYKQHVLNKLIDKIESFISN